MPKRKKKIAKKIAPKRRPRAAPKKAWKRERRVYIFPCSGGHDAKTYSRTKARELLCVKCRREAVNPNQLDLFSPGKTHGEKLAEASSSAFFAEIGQDLVKRNECKCGADREPSFGVDFGSEQDGVTSLCVSLRCPVCSETEVVAHRSAVTGKVEPDDAFRTIRSIVDDMKREL